MAPAAAAHGEREAFFRRGYAIFAPEASLVLWSEAAAGVDLAQDDIRCAGTWAPGVNALPNGADGALSGGPPLAGGAVDFARSVAGAPLPAWDRAQVSVIHAGYPGHGAEESEAAHRYRLIRDGAHVDGLERRGAARRRFLSETHAVLLGVPLGAAAPGASPFVVWEGSHEIIRAALRDALGGVAPEGWGEVDVTDAYHAARRRIFAACPRIEIAPPLGGAYVVHRLALHGVAAWRADTGAPWRADTGASWRADTGAPWRADDGSPWRAGEGAAWRADEAAPRGAEGGPSPGAGESAMARAEEGAADIAAPRRAVAYFRPDPGGDPAWWLSAP